VCVRQNVVLQNALVHTYTSYTRAASLSFYEYHHQLPAHTRSLATHSLIQSMTHW